MRVLLRVTILLLAAGLSREARAETPGLAATYYEYDSVDLSGDPSVDGFLPVLRDTVATLDFGSNLGAFATSGLVDSLAAVFSGVLRIPASGDPGLILTSAGFARLYVDGLLAIEQLGTIPAADSTASLELPSGIHLLRVEYFHTEGPSLLRLEIEGEGIPRQAVPPQMWEAGLDVAYFDFDRRRLPQFGALAPYLSADVPNLDYPATGREFAGSGRGDGLAARFEGWLDVPAAGAYTLFLESNDGSRLFLEDELVLDNDGRHVMVEEETTLQLDAGMHRCRVDYFEGRHQAGLILSWQSDAIAKQAIPPSAFCYRADSLTTANPVVDLGRVPVGLSSTDVLTVIHPGSPGDPPLDVTAIAVSEAFRVEPKAASLQPGERVDFEVSFVPTKAGVIVGTALISTTGFGAPLRVQLRGEGFRPHPASPNFRKGELPGLAMGSPTCLQFGPDGRLYVTEELGRIHALRIARGAAGRYQVVDHEVIDLAANIPNHDDDGTSNPAVTGRLATGLLVAGTAEQPVLYVSTSDPRSASVGGGAGTDVDTNSGVISRITRVGGAWSKLDLVRGLPRSESNHATNGLQLDTSTNVLYAAQGGNTNMGAPSMGFQLLPEFALSACILAIDLDAIGESTYDLPTLDDEDRPGPSDLNDPFGGNGGKNQAVLEEDGPVRVHSPGYRNPYDLLLTEQGRMYTIDNGANPGAGGRVEACTNEAREGGEFTVNVMHYVTEEGYYGGHPNPTRGSRANTFNSTNPQSPVFEENPQECVFAVPLQREAVAAFAASTNGLTEYTAGNFSGTLRGDLLCAGFSNTIWRVTLNEAGDQLTALDALFDPVGGLPLDVTALGDDAPFPGTVWVADYVASQILVYEPLDYMPPAFACTGLNSSQLDDDGDGFSNQAEIEAQSDPCDAADVPSMPLRPALRQNYPNPFNPGTTIEFELPVETLVTLQVFDVAGRRVRDLAKSVLYPAGHHALNWDGLTQRGRKAVSGVYLYRIQTPTFIDVRRMALIR